MVKDNLVVNDVDDDKTEFVQICARQQLNKLGINPLLIGISVVKTIV